MTARAIARTSTCAGLVAKIGELGDDGLLRARQEVASTAPDGDERDRQARIGGLAPQLRRELAPTRRLMLPGRPPASPRSGEMTTTPTCLTARDFIRGRSSSSAACVASRATSRISSSEYGRDATTRSCARRILLLATICTARVICATFLTDRMRRRISLAVAIPSSRELSCGA